MSNFRVGDLCTAQDNYDTGVAGIIYRVAKVTPNASIRKRWQRITDDRLYLKPVYVAFDTRTTKPRKAVSRPAGQCKKIDLVELGVEYVQLGKFIEEEAKRRAGDVEEAGPEEVPAGDAADDGFSSTDVDGAGLCADVSARGEVG